MGVPLSFADWRTSGAVGASSPSRQSPGGPRLGGRERRERPPATLRARTWCAFDLAPQREDHVRVPERLGDLQLARRIEFMC